MAAPASIDAIEWLRKQIEESAPDPLRAMLVEMVNLLMSAEVDAVCGAAYGERSDERDNQRNGYRERAWDTRVGTIGLKIPKLRHGSYFPGWLLEPRRRAEKQSPRWWPRRTCWASRRGRWRTWSRRSASRRCRRARYRSSRRSSTAW